AVCCAIAPPLLVQDAAAAPAGPDLLPVVQNRVSDARRLAALAADRHEIAEIDGRLALQDPALDVLLRVRLGMLADEVHALDDRPSLRGEHAQHAPGAPLALPGQDQHGVVPPDAPRPRHHRRHRQITSGARETIFMKFLSRSSRATGPKMRVPIGSPASLIRTAAFWSKRMYVPSRRFCVLFIRTITALTTWPFFTFPSGIASLTFAVITSPMRP